MLRFIICRLLVAIPTLFVIITLSFFMMHAAPGNPYDVHRKLPPEIEANVKKEYGLDKPLIVQYGAYLTGVLHGDFGPSLRTRGKSAMDIVKAGVPTSIKVGLPSLLLSMILGVGLGIAAALRQNKLSDYLASGVAILGICIPTFVLGPMLVFAFASKLGWLPVAGVQAGLKGYILPIVVLTIPGLAGFTRLTRAGMIEAMRSNFVRTARAKGVSEFQIVFRHALKPALLPMIGFFGPAVAGIVTGSLVVEKLFRLPGIGKQFYTAAIQRDYTLVMAVVILYAALIIVFNLIGDLIQALVDPRVRFT